MVDSPRHRFGTLFLIFFASGCSGLVYESIWSRYVKQLVGSAATAQVLVLALFMGGMSLGALAAGRWLGRLRHPILAYGILEGVIGLYAWAFPSLFDAASRLTYDVVLAWLGAGIAVKATQWVVAAALILPPCVLLGATFPLLSAGILRRAPERSGEILALLYFTNSLGAAIGAVLSGFFLVPTVGLTGALRLAGALNLLILLVALRHRAPARPASIAPSGRGGSAPLYLLLAFGTGMASFMYEVGWIRLLSMVLGSATHSFEVMLSAFILGLAAGGLWAHKRMDRLQRPELVLAIVQLVMGAAAVATLPMYWIAVQAMGWLMSEETRTAFDWVQFNVLRYLLCLLVMAPATFCAGMTLPLLTFGMLRRGHPEAALGQVYGWNTLGSIVGAVAAGLVLMPVVGLKTVIVLGAALDMSLGLLLLVTEIRGGRGNASTRPFLARAAVGSALVVSAGLLYPIDPMVLTSTVFRHGRTALPEHYRVLSYVDGRTASVTVSEDQTRAGYRILYTNGKPDASVVLERWPEGRRTIEGPEVAGDEPTQFFLGLLPLMIHPAPRHAALIGFGSGISCHTMLADPQLETLDTIEIEPEMVRAARAFLPANRRAYEDPRNRFRYDDAKAFFASAAKEYDVIVSEPTNPWVSGVSSLFTVEFYREIKRHLAPEGVLAQWIQSYELSDELLLSVIAALDREFEDYLVVRVGERDWVVLARPSGRLGPFEPRLLGEPGAREAFDLIGIHDIGQIDGLVAANRRMLHPLVSRVQPNTDAMPILDTGAERARFFRASADFLLELRSTPAPLLEVLGGRSRRRQPTAGLRDLRDPRVLTESEQALLLMRAYVHPDVPVPPALTTAPMRLYRSAAANLRSDEAWWLFTSATYGVYRLAAPYLELHRTPWWSEVLALARHPGAPTEVAQAIELLDALERRDAPRLRRAAEATLLDPRSPLPLPLRTVAGLVALERGGAPARERRAFAARWMQGVAPGQGSEAVAYRVLEAYARRDAE